MIFYFLNQQGYNFVFKIIRTNLIVGDIQYRSHALNASAMGFRTS